MSKNGTAKRAKKQKDYYQLPLRMPLDVEANIREYMATEGHSTMNGAVVGILLQFPNLVADLHEQKEANRLLRAQVSELDSTLTGIRRSWSNFTKALNG